MKNLSIALPCYNEEETIEQTVESLCDWLDARQIDGEVIAVDDGSTDDTRRVITELQDRHDNVRLVTHDRNRGYGAAVRSGLDAGTSEWIAFMDADGQFRASDFDKLIPYTREADVITGRRFRRADPLGRRLNAKAFAILNRIFFGIWVHDINGAMKMIRRSRWLEVRPRVTGGAVFNLELFARVKKGQIEWRQVFVNHYPRTAGQQTGANPGVILRAVREMAILRWKLWFPTEESKTS